MSNELFARYRLAALRMYGLACNQVGGEGTVRVPSYGGVHVTEDGAYVEMQVWVPKEKMNETEEGRH